MATADYWAEPKVVREQIVLFAPSLDLMISDDHEVSAAADWMRRSAGWIGASGKRSPRDCEGSRRFIRECWRGFGCPP